MANRKKRSLRQSPNYPRKVAKKEVLPSDKMEKVTSLSDLARRCESGDSRYRKLAVVAASNLGQLNTTDETKEDWHKALQGLTDMLDSLVGEYGENEADAEQTTINEINHCLDLIKVEDFTFPQ